MSDKTYKIGKKNIEISNIEKAFFQDINITKEDVINYYSGIADVMVPHMKDRPLNMHRAPDGVNGENFYQQEMSDYFPEWIDHAEVKKREGGTISHALCNNKESLVYLAGQAVLTFHVWLSKTDNIRKPDKLIFDLDPSPNGNFDSVIYGALKLKEYFDEKSATTYIMTTGSKGLHVIIPLRPENDFDEVRKKAEEIASGLSEKYPDNLTTEQQKNKRKGRLFLDYLRNSYGQTSVAPYSIRIIEGAPIATPLSWEELKDKDINSRTYNIKNIFRRMGQKVDPWRDFENYEVRLKNI